MGNLTGNPQQGLFAATVGFFTGFAAVALFGPTAQKFSAVMQLTPVMVGFLVAMPSLSGSLLRIPFSAWVDTNGGRKPFLFLFGLSITGMAGLALLVALLYPDRLGPGVYPLLLLLGLLSGSGIATFSVGISQVSYWFPKNRQGGALGIFGGVGNLAPGIFSLLIPLALAAIGLAGSYLVWLAFLVCGATIYFITGRNAWYFQLQEQGLPAEAAYHLARQQGQQIFPAGSLKDSLMKSARLWKIWALVAIYFTSFGGFIALTAWLPTYWQVYFGTSLVMAGMLTALYSVLTSLVRVVGGRISDRLGGETTILGGLAVMLSGAALMAASGHFGLSVLAQLCLAAGMGVTNAAVFKLVPQEAPEAVGGASGWVGGLGAFGGFAIPPLLGAIARAQGQVGYTTGFLVFAALALVSLGLAYLLKKSGRMRRLEARPKEMGREVG
jgi:MFS transporter, NNP family, nitrate/nitrite transporter